jgi:hypothetical protein
LTAIVTRPRSRTRGRDRCCHLNRWHDKHGLAEYFSCSVRWIEARMEEGLPHTYIAGRAKFKIAKSEAWLDSHGFIEWRGGDAA